MLFKGEWKAAVNMILDPREGQRDAVSKAREYYKETNDIDGTLRQLPRHLVAERAILQCLKKCPGNYLQALKAIPRTLRMMYIHSYQSYLWNHAASTRVQEYGPDQVVVGDLVYCKEYNNEKGKGITGADCKDDDSNDIVDSHDLDDSGGDLPEETNNPVKKPVDYEWELQTYTDGTIPLVETDLDIIAKSKPSHVEENRVNGIEERHVPNPGGKTSKHVLRDEELQTDDNEADSERETELQAESACGTNSQEPLMALKLSFTLPASCYATMAIRELLKTSTSVAFHKTLS